jgi:hypothetical protein
VAGNDGYVLDVCVRVRACATMCVRELSTNSSAHFVFDLN